MTAVPSATSAPFAAYETRAPSVQTAIDATEGWVGAFPPAFGISAGDRALFDDARIHFAAEQFGSLEGRRVLELGPLEGAHTWTLAGLGASVDAIEANRTAYLRCLVTKEVTGMAGARFHCGDAVRWLEEGETRYDLVVACGILYHMPDPLRLLAAIAARTDACYLWTHYVDIDAFPPGDERRHNWNATAEVRTLHGEPIRLFRRSYVRANEAKAFCGGAYDDHRWMDRTDILKALSLLGFGAVTVAHEDHSSPFGSSFSVFAQRV